MKNRERLSDHKGHEVRIIEWDKGKTLYHCMTCRRNFFSKRRCIGKTEQETTQETTKMEESTESVIKDVDRWLNIILKLSIALKAQVIKIDQKDTLGLWGDTVAYTGDDRVLKMFRNKLEIIYLEFTKYVQDDIEFLNKRISILKKYFPSIQDDIERIQDDIES